MPHEIEKIKLFINDNMESKKVAARVEKKLVQKGFEIVEENYDLAIAIGGDGAFLRMVKDTNFNSDIYYVGINTGTLGFLQEIKKEEIDSFIKLLKTNQFKIEYIGIQETTVKTKTRSKRFFSLNEIVVREKELNTMYADVYIDDVYLEQFVGDGFLVTTSTGSTAYNLSYGGSIIYPTFHTLELTPLAPLNNKAYNVLRNSIIVPENKVVTFIPRKGKNRVLITIDGENVCYDQVQEIKTVVNQKRIACLRTLDYNFIQIVQDKFLK